MIKQFLKLFTKQEQPKKFRVVPKPVGHLKGYITSGTLFIGDTRYMADDPQKYEGGVILPDPTNPFKDGDKFNEQHLVDSNLELPGSFNGDLPGRGVVIQTNMLSGGYKVERVEDENGKLIALWVVFND